MKPLHSIGIYYRTLSSEGHQERWRNGIYSSFLNTPPVDWIDIWNKTHSERIEEYNFEVSGTQFTKQAWYNFIKFSKIYSKTERWCNDHLLLASEVEGVYAFDNAQDTLEYGCVSPWGNKTTYVKFEGEHLGRAAEDNGYRVKVINIFGEWYQEDFIKKFNLTLPKC